MKLRSKYPLTIICFGLVWLFGAQSVSAVTLDEAVKLLASDRAKDDRFGYSVSVDGNIAVIGAIGDDDIGSRSGSAYLYVRSGGVWSQQAKLQASDGEEFDQFGRSVSVSGNTAVIGASNDDDNGSASGSAYVFDLSGATGVINETAKLLPSDGAMSDQFGFSVSVSGNTAVIGAFGDDDKGSSSGSAYVFDLSGATGVIYEAATLRASDGVAGDEFGISVSVSGTAAVIGAHLDDDNGGSSGSAYFFDLSGATGVINETAKLLPSDGFDGDEFGISVSVDGNIAVIGALGDDDIGSSSGSAYVFDLSGATSLINEAAKLQASDGAALDQFGISVAVSGTTAVIGADQNDASASGSAYFFDLSGATGMINEAAKLLASDGAADDQFGFSVSVSGNTAVIGAVGDKVGADGDEDTGSNAGAAYVFEFPVVDTVRSHYTCYKAKTAKGTNFFEARMIDLNDQFDADTYGTVKVERLCAPANKTPINFTDSGTDEPADLDGTHLLSYKIDASRLSCGACSGGVNEITIQYSGADPVDFIVDGKVTDTGPYPLASGESLTLFGDGNNGKMSSSIKFIDGISGDEIGGFHTSCSRPIGIGTESQNGLFTVTGGSSVNAGPLGVCDETLPVVIKPPWDMCAACEGGVSFAKFEYNGTPGAVTVTDSKGNTLFDSSLATGAMFEILPVSGKDKFEKTIFLTGSGGTVDIHTSCSKPFGPGLVVGDFKVLEGASKKGGADMCPVVRIDNQFGSEFLNVKKPNRLMVPSLKDLSGPVTGGLPTDTDHYKCYDVKALDVHKGLEVNLEDQFGSRDFEIDKLKQLCNPVEKTHGGVVTPIQNDANHLACYKIKPLQKGFCALVDPAGDPTGLPVGDMCSKDKECGKGLFCEKKVDTQAYLLNQFGDEVVNVEKAYEMCVPSTKTIDVL